MDLRTLPRCTEHSPGMECWCEPRIIETPTHYLIAHNDKIGYRLNTMPGLAVRPKVDA